MAQDPVIGAIQQQLVCYRRLAKLAELQHEHVQQDQTEALLEVLEQRQQVLDAAAALEQIIAPARQQWSEFLKKLDTAGRATAEALLAETRQLLEQITAADQNDVLVLQQRKLNLGRQIGQAAVGRQVNRTYAAAAYGAPRPKTDIQR